MATRQYIGARYVPKFADPIEWNNARSYEPLEIVTYLNTSYTSKKAVPVGVDITNSEYWVATGNYNAQMQELTAKVNQAEAEVDTLSILNNFNGKKIIILGDSISDEALYPNNWVKYLRDHVSEDTTIINKSINGCTVTRISGMPCVLDKMDEISDYDFSTADIVILFVGCNDIRNSSPMGFEWVGSDATMLGALYSAVTKLNTKAIQAKVCWVSPLKLNPSAWGASHKRYIPGDYYRNAIQTACKSFGIIYIDGYDAPRFNPINSNIYVTDGVHPTAAYSGILANWIYTRVNGYSSNNNYNRISLLDRLLLDTASDDVTVTAEECILDGTDIVLNATISYTASTTATGPIIFTLPDDFKAPFNDKYYFGSAYVGRGASQYSSFCYLQNNYIILFFPFTPSVSDTIQASFTLRYNALCAKRLGVNL